MVSVRKAAAAVMMVGLMMTGCVVTTEPAPGSAERDTADYALMETTWQTMPADVRVGICAGFIEDEDAAVDLFFASAVAGGVDPLPSEIVVRAFFSDHC